MISIALLVFIVILNLILIETITWPLCPGGCSMHSDKLGIFLFFLFLDQLSVVPLKE